MQLARATLVISLVVGCGRDHAGGDDGEPPADASVPLAPVAMVAFPTVTSTLPHGAAYPIVVAATDDAGVEHVDILVDGVAIAGGPGSTTVWRSAETGTAAGAASTQAITADGSLELTIPARFTQKVVGLGDVDTGGVQADIDVGFYFTLQTFNLVGASAGVRGYASGDVFRITVGASTVEWRHNGTLLATAARPAGALHPEAWLPSAGAAVANAQIAIGGAAAVPVAWTALVDASVATAFATTWSTLTHPDGVTTITARARDVEGASADSPPVAVAVDNTAPICQLTTPNGGTVTGTVTLSGTAGDASLAVTAFFVDGALHSQHDGQAAPSSSWNTTAVSDGMHTVELRAFDRAFHMTACPTTVMVSNP